MYRFFVCSWISFFVYVTFSFQFNILFSIELRDFFVIFEKLFVYLLRFTEFIDMFDTLLIIILFLLASLLVCLLTLRLSINIKHSCPFFHSLAILMNFLKFQSPPPVYLAPKSRKIYSFTAILQKLFLYFILLSNH